jgi:hypothetical protein
MVAMGLILPLVGARNEYGLAFVVGLLLAAVLFDLAGRFDQVAVPLATAFFPHLPASIAVCGGLP